MQSFPLFIRLDGQRVVIVGGTEEAAQKLRLIGRTEAAVTLMAPDLVPELAAAVAEGRAVHHPAVLDIAALNGARIAIVCTGCAGADAAAADLARAAGAIVNVVDRPGMCDATMPALVDRDPVVVAIGTEGAAPVLSRRIKTALEAMLEPRLGAFAALAWSLRPAVAFRVAPAARRRFWEWAFEGPRARFAAGDEAGARAELEAAIEAGRAPGQGAGRISLLDPGPGPADLVSLRAVQRLQAADAILHGPLADPALLELPRRDAEREAVNGPPEEIAAALAAIAAAGRNAVWLGDRREAIAAAMPDGAPSPDLVPPAA